MTRKLVVAIDYDGWLDTEPVTTSDLALALEMTRGFDNACVWDEQDFLADVDDEGDVARVLTNARRA